MKNLFSVLFGKNKNLNDPDLRRRYGMLSGWIGIFLNLLLSFGKLTVGILFSSISVIADALNNLSDAGSSLISVISFRISAKPPDKKHPFGHARIEYVASMIVSFLILLVSYELLVESVNKIRFGGEQVFSAVTLWVLGAAVLVKVMLGIFNRFRIDSEILKATAFDSFSDALSSLAVLICLVISRISGVDLDGYVGVCVSIVIAVAGVKVLNDTKNSILGESPKAEQIEKIRAIVAEYPDVLGIHDLVVHQYGPSFAMVSLHAEVDGNRNFFEMHDTIDLVEQRLNREMHVIATIHMDPIVVDDEQTLLLREQVVQVVRSIDPSLNIHDFRFVDGVSHINLIFDLEASFDIPMTDDALCDRVRSKVSELDQKYKCVISVDRS